MNIIPNSLPDAAGPSWELINPRSHARHWRRELPLFEDGDTRLRVWVPDPMRARGQRVYFELRNKLGQLMRSETVVVTVSGTSRALPGTDAGSVKVTPFAEYPGKGRATGGVRCHRFLKGEDILLLAWAGPSPARAAAASGAPIELPPADGRRDGSGTPAGQPIAAVSSAAG